jgi:cytoskeleton protein RodZ
LTEVTGIGAQLKQAREARGLAIDDVAQQLKFAPRQIESLEHERFDRLPGPTIARGMVRNYARLLKLDPEPLLERMAPRVEKAPDPGQIAARFRQPVPFSDGAKRSTLVYAGFSIGLLILVGVVAYEWQQEKAAPEFEAPAQSQRPPPVERTQTAAATPSVPVVSEPPRAPVVVPEEKKKAEPPKVVAAIEKPAVEKPLAAGMHRIVLRVNEEEAWLEVKDGSGRSLVSSLNQAGTERSVRARPPIEIVIGNPGSVTLTHNGKPVDLTPYTKVGVARLTLQ